MKLRSRCLVVVLGSILAAPEAIASDLGKRLDYELTGGWGVLEVEVYSACGSTYSDNQIGAAGVTSKAPRRFGAGELAKIDNVKVKRQRIDLMLTLASPLRVSFMDGPFELYDQRSCRVQLMVLVPRELVKSRDLEALLAEVRKHITVYPSRDAARASDTWNGREAEPLPDDYDQTLQRHAAWKAEQTNAAIRAEIETALAEAAEVIDAIDDDAGYLDGFGAGAATMAEFTVTDCGSLLNASFSTYRKRPANDTSRSWQDGWNDGQKLVFHVLLADRLRSCLMPVPVIIEP